MTRSRTNSTAVGFSTGRRKLAVDLLPMLVELTELGERFGVSAERIKQIESDAVDRLRRQVYVAPPCWY